MLEAMLLAAIVAAPLGSAALFLPARRHQHDTGAWPPVRRFTLALVGTVVVAAAAAGVLRLLRASEHNLVTAVAALVFASLVWLPVTRRWSARAHVCWASSIFLFVVYLTYAFEWTLDSHLGPFSTVGGLLLWLLEVFAALLSCAYLWEICDALGTERWRRRITPTTSLPMPYSELPVISLHVPAHNEPPDMVAIDTLRALLRSDYPRYEVVLIDDNTDDESLWRPVEAWCGRHGLKFAHLENWPGYKSGALNYALRKLTSPDAELIGVVDSDYQLKRGFLRRAAPAFADPWIGFVQAPQDYRDWRQARYYRRLVYHRQVLLRRLPAVAQRARRGHLRRDHGPDPPGGPRRTGRLGRVVHHRGRRDVPAAAAGRVARAAPGPVLGLRDHAADVRGAQGPAVPVVLRRHPDPAHALALAAARPHGTR